MAKQEREVLLSEYEVFVKSLRPLDRKNFMTIVELDNAEEIIAKMGETDYAQMLRFTVRLKNLFQSFDDDDI